MPYSTVYEGKVLDWKFTKTKHGFTAYNFYIGDILIGQLFKMKEQTWSAVSFFKTQKVCPVDGFRSRYHAAQFLLKVNGLQR